MQRLFKLNTIDLDKCDHEFFYMVYTKIQNCPYHGAVDFEDTPKGYHLIFRCEKDCDLCRVVFDDQKRFAIDWKRPECKQNVLFTPFSAHRV